MNAITSRGSAAQFPIRVTGGCEIRLHSDALYRAAVTLTPCRPPKLPAQGFTVATFACWPAHEGCNEINEFLRNGIPARVAFHTWAEGLPLLSRLLHGIDPSKYQLPFGVGSTLQPGISPPGWRA